MAGYSVQLWPILQDIHQLKTIYKQNSGTFIANAGLLQIFGVNDYETAKMVSDMLGQKTVEFQTTGTSEKTGFFSDSDSSKSTNQHIQARALMTPDEVMNMPKNQALLLISGSRPVKVMKLAYYQDKEFKGLFDNT